MPPPRLTLHDELVATANLLERRDAFDAVLRLLRAPLSGLGPRAAVAFQVAPNLDAALAMIVARLNRANPHLRVAYAQCAGQGEVTVDSPFLDGRLFDAIAMATLALVYRLAESLHGKVGPAARLSLGASGPRQAVLADDLSCPTDFAATRNRLLIPAALLATPNPRADPLLWELLHRPRSIGATAMQDGLTRILVGSICQHLDHRGRVPRLKQVADELNLSERTIIRTLHGEGTSFRQLVDGERMRRAVRLVNDRSIELARIAGLLGFADAPSFWRSFRRWFGVTPTEFRH